MVPFLKMKICTLAAEARIIRHEEQRYGGPKWGPSGIRLGLHEHRVIVLRKEQRACLLAYGFLRGRGYDFVEKDSSLRSPDWEAVERMVTKFGTDDLRDRMQKFAAWKDGAKERILALRIDALKAQKAAEAAQ